MDVLTETASGTKRTPLCAIASGKPGDKTTDAGKTKKTRSSASAGPEAAGAGETLSLLRAPTALSNYLP